MSNTETKPQLTPEDWINAGFRALAEQGPAAIQINQLAKALGATKGSFYWHFKGLPAYKTALLAAWRRTLIDDVASDLAAADPGAARFDVLVRLATEGPGHEVGGRKIDSAMRAWALAEGDVAAALAEIDTARLALIESVLWDMGLNGAALAPLVYGAYIGVDDLAARGAIESAAPLSHLKSLLIPSK